VDGGAGPAGVRVLSAGVAFTGVASSVSEPVAVAVFVGLVAGKVIGITGGAWVTTKLSRAELNPDLGRPDAGQGELACSWTGLDGSG
jgi:NhaA family Na+:H+ antiporter